MTISLNINRLNHLLSLFRMTRADLLLYINELKPLPKVLITENDIFKDEIKLSLLKRVDELFDKGIAYYMDPSEPISSKEESIFFRKDSFNTELNIGSKKIVNKFEEEKIAFSTLAKLSDFKIKRIVPVYSISDSPKEVAKEIRKNLYPQFSSKSRVFLESFIKILADNNILVFEFIETHNKKDKANINGFYLSPNVIVLKRNQKSIRREIFTLAHELGHYLINEEEIDDNVNDDIFDLNLLNKVERWCNDFAYFFLIGDYDNVISSIKYADSNNDYYHDEIGVISQKTNLSTLSLYTRLRINGKISQSNYDMIKIEILRDIHEWELQEKARIDFEKQKALEEGRILQMSTPKPIISPLYLKTLQSALYSGLINEMDFCKKLAIKPEKIERFLV